MYKLQSVNTIYNMMIRTLKVQKIQVSKGHQLNLSDIKILSWWLSTKLVSIISNNTQLKLNK